MPQEIDAALARRSGARRGGDRRRRAGPRLCKERRAWRENDGTPRRVVEEERIRKEDESIGFCVVNALWKFCVSLWSADLDLNGGLIFLLTRSSQRTGLKNS